MALKSYVNYIYVRLKFPLFLNCILENVRGTFLSSSQDHNLKKKQQQQQTAACGVSGSLYALMLWAFGCSCMYSCLYRTKLRAQYSLEEKPCGDCCVHCCCESCSLCQEYRELQNRGFNLSIGIVICVSLPSLLACSLDS